MPLYQHHDESDDGDNRDYYDSDYHDSDEDKNVGKNKDKIKIMMVIMMTIVMINRGILVTGNH